MVNNAVFEVMQAFPRSFMNQHGELIVCEKTNLYFKIANYKDDIEIKCKVLEWLSRDSIKAIPYKSNKKNLEYREWVANGINKFLRTDFTHEELIIIYQELGNQVNRPLTLKFIKSGYDMRIFTRG